MPPHEAFGRVLFAALLLAAGSPASAEALDVSVSNGLPQVSDVGGRVQAWRYVAVSAESDLLRVEAKLPAAAFASAGAAPLHLSHQLEARLFVPQAFEGAPELSVAVRSWAVPRGARAGVSAAHGALAEAEVSRSFGAVSLFVGRSVPLDSAGRRIERHATFGGFEWAFAERHRTEFEFDLARERRFTLRHVYALGEARARLYLSRNSTRATAAWESGLGVAWRF